MSQSLKLPLLMPEAIAKDLYDGQTVMKSHWHSFLKARPEIHAEYGA